MKDRMSRILIETTVRQTLKGLKENPKRSIRNLVDMALQFSDGRFQSQFFQTAHTMLENENSAYYALVEDATNHIETEHLVKFGMNLGYNSCTQGARQIRENEKELGFNIPWTVLFQMDQPQCLSRLPQYDSAIEEGEKLGIFSWMLLANTNPADLLPLIQRHPNCAFFLFCRPEDVTADLLEELAQITHLMPVIRYGDAADEVCAALRKAELPYSVYCPYGEKELQQIVSGELFSDTQQLHPIFTALAPRPDCPDSTRRLAHQAAVSARQGQAYQTVPWELYYDTRNLDEIISDDACCVLFDSQGRLIAPDNQQAVCGSLFADGLTSLIQQAYPKNTSVITQ